MRKILQPVGVNGKLNTIASVIGGAGTLVMFVMFLLTKEPDMFIGTLGFGVFSAMMLLFLGISSVYLIRKTNSADIDKFNPVTLLEYRYPEFSIIEDDPKEISKRIPGKPGTPMETDEEYEPV